MSLSIKLIPLVIWVFALLLATWVLNRLPLDTVSCSVAGLNLSQWLIWIILNILTIIFLTWRWHVLSKAIKFPINFFQLLRIRQAGQLISFVTPGPQFGGEPLQIYWLWRKHSMPAYAAILSVGLDRFFELWINFTILLAIVLILLSSDSYPIVNWQYISFILTSLVIIMIAVGWSSLRRPQTIKNWLTRIVKPWLSNKRLRNLDTQLLEFNDTLQEMFAHHWKNLLIALGLSLFGWTAILIEFWLLLSFIDIPLSPIAFFLLFTLVRLAFLMPLPGGIGTVEAAIFWGFQLLSFSLSAATNLILLMRLRDLTILLISALLLPRLHTLKDESTGIQYHNP